MGLPARLADVLKRERAPYTVRPGIPRPTPRWNRRPSPTSAAGARPRSSSAWRTACPIQAIVPAHYPGGSGPGCSSWPAPSLSAWRSRMRSRRSILSSRSARRRRWARSSVIGCSWRNVLWVSRKWSSTRGLTPCRSACITGTLPTWPGRRSAPSGSLPLVTERACPVSATAGAAFEIETEES